jgi:O-succinylbenzoic acid--CoA ligase
MSDWLKERAAKTPHHPAVVTPDSTLTYAQLNALADDYSRHFRAGTRAGLLLPNSADTVALIWGAIRAGAVLVPLNTRLTFEEIRWQLQNTGCRSLFVGESLLDAVPWDAPKRRHDLPFREFYLPRYEGFKRPQPSALHDDSTPRSQNMPFAIVHTSGTSGQPKGAVLSYNNVFASAMASAYRIGHLPDDRWLCVLPLYHVGGLSILIRACLYGITVHLHEHFDVQTVNRALSDDGVTLVSLVPTMLYRLLNDGTPQNWQHLRLALIGGAATTPQLMQRCIEQHIPVATTYGLSEAASQVATTLPGDAARKPGTVGKPLMFTQVRVVDEQDNDLAPGDYGEVIVQGPSVMQGYYGNPEATRETLRGGWLHTGDIGYLDEDGDLFLVQRRSDLIVTGGENVYPAEVEDVLRQHPAIAEAAVIGVDDPEWGQQVAAAIVRRPDKPLRAEAVQAHSREHLAGYKIPRQIVFVDALPQTASGKISRPALRDLFR